MKRMFLIAVLMATLVFALTVVISCGDDDDDDDDNDDNDDDNDDTEEPECETNADCADDGLFCTGDEYCDTSEGICKHEGDPCDEPEVCNEEDDICGSDCGDGPYAVFSLTSEMKWQDAEGYCVDTCGGHMASITSQSEQDDVIPYLGSDWDRCWIGLHKVSGNWQWSSGEAFSYDNWAPGQPGEEGPVVFMFGTHEDDPPFDAGTWNDTDDIVDPYVEIFLCEF